MMTSLPTSFSKMLLSKSGPPSETQSEISSVDSDWSDIRAIAAKLGVANVEDLHTERFKVDRQKLENMIKTDSSIENFNSAEFFFDSVMQNTSTCISWPCRLKIGAKSKKDPHVRIVGKPDDVQNAKERVLASLDSRGTRVIMKMDVSYTDHSYIIGRGGNNIKRIMESTSTHIHFPDSNRSNPTEKSNQVSLCGNLEGVERARSLVRLSTPLLISFELPIMAPGRPAPDHETPFIKEVEAKYNVQVIFSTRPKLHSSLVLVKGSEKEAARVQEATQILINFTCENIANQILVHMQLEISPQHHEIVKGSNNTTLLGVMERTKTKIIFPDLSDMNIKSIKKSQVTITGTIDGVYRARQQLLGNLPIALIFDFPEIQTNASELVSLNTKYGVAITIRQKQRQSTLAVVIKGVEKFIDKIYEARHEILKLTTPITKADIPSTYFGPNDNDLGSSYRCLLTSLLSNFAENPMAHGGGSPFNNNNSNNNATTNNNNNLYRGQNTPTRICAPTQKYLQVHNNFHRNQPTSNYLLPQPQEQQQISQMTAVSPRNSVDHNTSGYRSFCSSTTSLEQVYPPYRASSDASASCTHYSPDSTYRGRRLSEGGMQGAAGIEPRNYDMNQHRSFDFDMKRIIGFKAMECPPQEGELRTPTPHWAGLGISRTSPVPMETTASDDMAWNRKGNHLGVNGAVSQLSPYNLGATTGIVDSTPTNRRLQLTQHKDIHSLLTCLGLEHYIKTFVLNEIDLEMFVTLTEDNLIELGITAFGARKKLLVAIHTLQAHEAASSQMPSSSNASPRFCGSAAPGAERRGSNAW